MSEKKAKAPGKTGPKSVPPKSAAPKSAKAKAAAAAAPVAEKPVVPEVKPTEERSEHSFRRKILGLVVSDKMAKTVTVEVIRKAMNPMYKKYVRVRNKYKAHDELNQYKVGDRVEIMESRPISHSKRWVVTRLVSRAVEA
jgi:small subunit ribosomal protein S17